MKDNAIKLSDHFTFGKLIRFTLSPIVMMIFTSTYGVVDGFFVSNYAGATAFSALNLSVLIYVFPLVLVQIFCKCRTAYAVSASLLIAN